jgi:hypothetical protein
MISLKSNKTLLALFFCVLSALLVPAIAQAELGGSGSKAANEAAEQRAAKAEKAEKRKQHAEAKKAAEAQSTEPAGTQTPVVK